MLLSSVNLMDMAVVGAGAAAGGALGSVVGNVLPQLPGNLLLPISIGLGAGAAHSLYDIVSSERQVSLGVEGKTAIWAGATAFALGPLGLGGSLPVVGPMIQGGALPAVVTLGFLSGALTSLLGSLGTGA